MRLYEEIFLNNQNWVAEKLAVNPAFFSDSAKQQNPEFLYIGCSDSRVSAEDLMGMEPGEVFVHRNVANLVNVTDNNLNAVVQYAVDYLHVKHIVVCGHYGCGGVKAAMIPSDMGQLNNWLQILRDVYRYHQATLDAITNEKERFDKLVELNVQEQCINIIKIDHVQRAWYKTGFPHIYGWVYDNHTGLLKDLKLDVEEIFKDMRKIYDIRPIG